MSSTVIAADTLKKTLKLTISLVNNNIDAQSSPTFILELFQAFLASR